jgi:predicted SprT family Zn-dependent metalloprotease
MLYDSRSRRWLPCHGDVGTQSVIQLSRSYVERSNRRAVTETILHEIAHALVGLHHAHAEKWKAVARRIGANPNWLCDDSRAEPSRR